MLPWPMNILTKVAGSSRKLVCHPKRAVSNSAISKDDNGRYDIATKGIKIKPAAYYLEKKEQGHRHFYGRTAEGQYVMFGRRLNVEGTYPDIYNKVKTAPLPELPLETVVDCELIWPGHPDSSIPTAIKECPEELRIKIFAMPIWLGNDYTGANSLSYTDGRLLVSDVCGSEYLVECLGKMDINKRDGGLGQLLDLAEHNGYEGIVLKGHSYNNWWKLKGLREADVFVTDFKVSKSDTRYGMVTSVNVAVYDTTGKIIDMGRVSGFKEKEMEEMTAAYNYYYHGNKGDNPFYKKVLRVTYQEIASKGKMKHGFFDGWREDKSAEECTKVQFTEETDE